MSHIYETILGLLRGGSSPITDHRKLSESWDAKVQADPERDLNVLADRIDSSWKGFTETVAECDWEELKLWHGTLKAHVYTLAAILIQEPLIHGLDVAQAAGEEWAMSPDDARLVTLALLPTLPNFMDTGAAEGVDATWELRIRGAQPVFVTVVDGTMTIALSTERKVDCRISAEPLNYLLIGFGRRSQYLAILKGSVVAWGRKPWLGVKFGKLFVAP
jgi:hypothetical protein